MYSQTFTADNLYRLTRQSERRDFAPDNESKQNLLEYLRQTCEYIIKNDSLNFRFREVNGVYVNDYDNLDGLVQELIIRKIYENIKRIYKIKQANRNSIIKQIVVLLKDTYPSYIIRLDIKKFYDSIELDKIISKLTDDIRLNHHSISLIKKIFSDSKIKTRGLPKGISLSSILSELYMKKIDDSIRHIDGIYYYERFVDDIIIFCNGQENFKKIQDKVCTLLYNKGLKLNYNKKQFLNDFYLNQGKKLTYLGYSFKTSRPNRNAHTCNILETELAATKVKAFKTKITKSFVHFAKSDDFDLLKQRIKFLTGNYWVSNPSDLRPIKAGIYYNYSLLTSSKLDQLKDLDYFYQHMLHCKTGKLGSLLKIKLSDSNINELEHFGFHAGWEKRILSYFTPTQIGVIKSCWR